MSCCNHDCNQGRTCPVRAARDSGVCCTDPDTEASDTKLFVVLMVIVYCICAYVAWVAGQYVIATYGEAIKSIFWGVMARIS